MAKSESVANLSLADMADARIDAIIAARIKAMRVARRNARRAPKLGDILAGNASKADYFAHVNGR